MPSLDRFDRNLKKIVSKTGFRQLVAIVSKKQNNGFPRTVTIFERLSINLREPTNFP